MARNGDNERGNVRQIFKRPYYHRVRQRHLGGGAQLPETARPFRAQGAGLERRRLRDDFSDLC